MKIEIANRIVNELDDLNQVKKLMKDCEKLSAKDANDLLNLLSKHKYHKFALELMTNSTVANFRTYE